MGLDKKLVRAPEFPEASWLNADVPPTRSELRGRVVLVEFWDFTCVNCLRTLPHLRSWHTTYRQAGLQLLGVHTPEFEFARNPAFVEAACRRLGVLWPVALDPDQTIWTSFANAVWPSVYLVDAEGYLRLDHAGEGAYDRVEAAFRSLLVEAGAAADRLPPPVSEEAFPDGSVCLPATPELQVEALGEAPPIEDQVREYALPDRLREGAFYLNGAWKLNARGLSLAMGGGGVVLPFQADSLNAVLSPFPGPDGAASDPARVEVLLDGAPVDAGQYGADLRREGPRTLALIDSPRLYHLADHLGPGRHELRLVTASPGLTVYAFSFAACREPASTIRSRM